MPSISQRFWLMIALTAFASGGAGFLLGHRGSAGSDAREKSAPIAALTATPSPRVIEPSRDLALADFPPAASDLAAEDVAGAVVAAGGAPDYFQRRHDFYALGRKLDTATIRSAMDTVQGLPDTQRDEAQYTLIARWLELDPAAAYEWVDARPLPARRSELMREFFHSLELKNPDTALAYLPRYAASANRGEDFTSSVFEAWSSRDPAAAWVVTIASPETRDRAGTNVYYRWKNTDPKGAANWLQTTKAISQEAKKRLLRDDH